jgi:GT2 family glycosyltransferase
MKDQKTPLISVVVLNWNGGHMVQECLMSLQSQSYKPLEIIVVDNASTDKSVDLIRMGFPKVKLIVNDRNLGFGGGNNVGIKVSRGNYIIILNNDARLDHDCIKELKGSIEKDKKYGACASKILLDGKGNLLDAAGITIYQDGLSIGRGRLENADHYQREEEVFCLLAVKGLFNGEK